MNSFVAKQALHKTAIISLLVLVAPISMAFAKDNEPATQVAEIKLNTNSSQLVSIESGAPVIVPGDSMVQAEAKRIEEEKRQIEAALAAEKAKASRVILTREYRVSTPATPDPASFDSIYAGAESTFGVDARILKAVHYVETGMTGSTSKASYAGAVGPMQFLPSTFRSYAYDGNGDGLKEITNVYDAIYTAARYLKACGYPDVRQALYGYNHSDSYVNKVLKIARSLGFPQ